MRANPEPTTRGGEAGFSLIELMIASVVLTVGLVGMAELLAVSTVMHTNARLQTNSTYMAQTKFDELSKLTFATAPAIQVGGSLTANVANYNDTPVPDVTRRWLVVAGPTADTRIVTVRIITPGAKQFAQRDLTTVIRQW
jgi:prepilin-type N-terminal cleavage/methylation domain-containing protein